MGSVVLREEQSPNTHLYLEGRWWLRKKMQKRDSRLWYSWELGMPLNYDLSMILGKFLMEDGFWTFCTWAFLYAKGKLGNKSKFPQNRRSGAHSWPSRFRDSRNAIPLHFSFFIWKMEISVHAWLTQHLIWFLSRLPFFMTEPGRLETQFLRLFCS